MLKKYKPICYIGHTFYFEDGYYFTNRRDFISTNIPKNLWYKFYITLAQPNHKLITKKRKYFNVYIYLLEVKYYNKHKFKLPFNCLGM